MILNTLFFLHALVQSPQLDPGKSIGHVLDRLWPSAPEATQMLAAILADEAMNPEKGWWRRSISQRDWPWLAAWSDGNQDHRIDPGELPQPPDRFLRLDVDDDGSITQADFAPGARDTPASIAALFRHLDTDRDDQISEADLSRFLHAADRRQRGFLTRRDLTAMLPELATSGGRRRASVGSSRMPDRWGFLFLFLNGQLGSFRPGPAVGEQAPAFELRDLATGNTVSLRDQLNMKPVVLIFGSFT